jgi:hypothetical protein
MQHRMMANLPPKTWNWQVFRLGPQGWKPLGTFGPSTDAKATASLHAILALPEFAPGACLSMTIYDPPRMSTMQEVINRKICKPIPYRPRLVSRYR